MYIIVMLVSGKSESSQNHPHTQLMHEILSTHRVNEADLTLEEL